MLFLSEVKIRPKLGAIVAAIAVIVRVCIWFAQTRMTQINDAYRLLISREAKGVSTARRVDRLVFGLNHRVDRSIAETEDDPDTGGQQRFRGHPPADAAGARRPARPGPGPRHPYRGADRASSRSCRRCPRSDGWVRPTGTPRPSPSCTRPPENRSAEVRRFLADVRVA